MSAGNAGNNGMSPPEGDDPFGYLYRQEGGAPGAPAAPPQQPSYRQVRPVGERTYAGQQQPGGYGYPQQQSPYYAAPETQPGNGYPAPGGGHPGGPGRGGYDDDEPPRRNTMLIGAIAVVTAVVLGVGAAILFSGDDEGTKDDGQGQVEPGPSDDNPGEGEGGDDEGEAAGDPGEDEDGDEEPEEEFEPIAAELAGVTPLGGAFLNSGEVSGARSGSGNYFDGLNRENATVLWSFDFDGTPGDYRLFIGYSVPEKDQKMSLAINEQIRDGKINFNDYLDGEKVDRSQRWFHTYQVITLKEGRNDVYVGCAKGDSCDVLIDKMEIVEDGARPEWAPGSS